MNWVLLNVANSVIALSKNGKTRRHTVFVHWADMNVTFLRQFGSSLLLTKPLKSIQSERRPLIESFTLSEFDENMLLPTYC
jgi:hypothetical protein